MSEKKPVYSWERLNMSEKEWRLLAGAFYNLAHNDFEKFHALPEYLQNHPAGMICRKYIETGNHSYVDEAGVMIAGTKHWYVSLGR